MAKVRVAILVFDRQRTTRGHPLADRAVSTMLRHTSSDECARILGVEAFDHGAPSSELCWKLGDAA